MNIAFCTCVQIGLSCIEAVQEIGGEFKLFLSLKDEKSKKKSGRIYLDDISNKTRTPLVKINHINDQECIDALKEHDIDWLFIIGWSQIASKEVIEIPLKGTIGAHPTLLPVGRGRAAVPWAIIKGLDKTGVSFFKMDEGVDTGEILGQFEIPLTEKTDASHLYSEVNEAHIKLIKKIWPSIQDGSLKGVIQDETLASYWDGRKPADGELSTDMNLLEVDRLVRATTKPYPGAFLNTGEGKIIFWKGSLEKVPGAKEFRFKDGLFFATETEFVLGSS